TSTRTCTSIGVPRRSDETRLGSRGAASRLSGRRSGRAASFDGHGRGRELDAAAVVLRLHEPFGFVQLAELNPHRFPLLEVLGDGDAPALAGGLADAEVLVEVLAVSGNGGLVLTKLRPHVVGRAIGGDRAMEGAWRTVGRSAGWLRLSPVVEDVVLD